MLKPKFGITGTQLKVLAMILMVLDISTRCLFIELDLI